MVPEMSYLPTIPATFPTWLHPFVVSCVGLVDVPGLQLKAVAGCVRLTGGRPGLQLKAYAGCGVPVDVLARS